MYKIKRFSSYMPVRGLGMERYYSEYLEQREYGFLGDIYKKGPKRLANNVKKSINSRINRSINKAGKELDESRERAAKLEPVVNLKLHNKLVNEQAKDLKTGVTPFKMQESGRGSMAKSEDITEDFLNELKRSLKYNDKVIDNFRNLSKSNKYVVSGSFTNGADTLAHELGHVDNIENGGIIRRSIHKLSSKKNLGKNVIGFGDKETVSTKGIKQSIKGLVSGKILAKEESNASKKGLEFLKKHGASEDELKKSKELYDAKLDTYKKSGKLSALYPLRDFFKIENKRGN